MGEFVTYLIPALVVLVLVTVTAWVVYVNAVQRKPRITASLESRGDQQRSNVVPTEGQLRETFETWQQGGKEGLIRLLKERQRQAEQAAIPNEPSIPDESEPQDETLAQRLKRLSLEGHPGGKFGKGTRLGPISFARLPRVSDEPSEE
jgi:hypothetical protein